MTEALKDKPVDRKLLLSLMLVLAMGVLPHLWNLNHWITGFFYAALALRLLFWRKPQHPPRRWLLLPLVFIGLFLVVTQAGYTEGRQFGVALLVVMLGMKLLELKTRRDLYVTVLLGYFLLITQFLFTKNFVLTLYVLALSIGFTSILNRANRVQEEIGVLEPVKQSALLLLGAVPVMALLFFLFPRLEGPLWTLNLGRESATTGMSDNIQMGSVSQVSQSYETAFRVIFQGDPPPPQQRYWRGLVLWYTDGRNWERGLAIPQPVDEIVALDPPLSYEIIMEASNQKWLFPLDRLISRPVRLNFNHSGELSTRRPLASRYSFRATSSTAVWNSQISDYDRKRGLQLPDNITDRMRGLSSDWRSGAETDRDVVQAALAHFNQQPFIYTLQPPPLLGNPVDEFLFDSRKGFCEHYATSFVTLMRLSGIPARVIGGYQGGELNPQGGHLIVRQADAHAWAEVWLNEEGWVRVDPTAAVAPERIEHPIDISLLDEGAPVVFYLGDLGVLPGLWREVGWLADNLEVQWHNWIVEYNRSRQASLLDSLGLGFLKNYHLGLAAVFASFVVAGLVFLFLVYRTRRRIDPVQGAYVRFRSKLSKAGLTIPRWTGPLDLADSAISRFPASAAEIRAITGQYVALRYGRGYSREVANNLRRRVRAFRVKAR